MIQKLFIEVKDILKQKKIGCHMFKCIYKNVYLNIYNVQI